ncbi:hypothetical protein [Priestia taiwanensis]|uniref:Uncharacterized protein n=1 Tax=Priestia taiwanensis TaxID=1347902 RepID=A0A917AHS8_9BACI|nr:hypothetical protein [Priestia taiwanensis]MBM7361502.1 hypothetical protein [Priestia taiwanensis]GGE54685.1 hypothetical protein GCM10007140_01230 [Priestia taiwanensis]
MIISNFAGYELEKAQPNTSEDFFNRSEVTYTLDGVEKTLYVLYVRFFDEKLTEFTPFTENPLFTLGEKEVTFKDVVALICLLKDPRLTERKRIYISEQDEFTPYFENVSLEELKGIAEQILNIGTYEAKTPTFK